MTLEERVQQLEEKLGRLEAILHGELIGGTGRTLQGSRIQVTNDAGKVLAEMLPSSDGVELTLNDNEQKCRAVLSATKYGPVLKLDRLDCPGTISCWIGEKGQQYLQFHRQAKSSFSIEATGEGKTVMLCDDQNKPRLSLQLDANGNPQLFLRDANVQPRVMIGSRDDETYIVSLGDRQSQSRLGLQVDGDGNPTLHLWSSQSDRRLMISFDQTRRGLSLHDAQGLPRLLLALDEQDRPGIFLVNEDGKFRVGLVSDDEHHGLRIYDSHEKGRVAITVNADERPEISLHDANQTCRIRLTQMPDNSAIVTLYNEAGKTELTLSTMLNSPSLILCDPHAKPRAILSMVNGNPALTFVDQNGDPTFTAP